MPRLVECVPNFSEGRDRSKIDAITAAISSAAGVSLLDVDPGAETNRTVVTFVGEPEAVLEGAFRGIAEAARILDMRTHHGAHARLGATDVCPFIPVSGVTMEECVELARKLGARVGSELGIPVYLYEYAASRPERKNLADVREGEYESLPSRTGNPHWTPDFGPASFPPKSGATVIGARQFLIAYNVNLNTRSKKLAHDIALEIREKGRRKLDASGAPMKNKDGSFVMSPGKLRECKAVGWYIPEYGAAQISINLTNFHVTSLHDAFEAVAEEATRRGLRVTGSEIVGLVPLEAIRKAGIFYLRRQGLSAGVAESELVHVAAKSLGLSDLTPFQPQEKIIEYRLRRKDALVDRTLRGFVDELSSESAAPGGGSAAALLGALSASLSAMVALLTATKKGFEKVAPRMSDLGIEAQSLKDVFLEDVDRDTDAFLAVLAASRLPKKTPEEIAARDAAQARAERDAIAVPLSVLERSHRAAELAREVALHGNPNSLSDAGVAAFCARSCAEGAFANVLINLTGKDDAASESLRARAEEALSRTLAVTEETTRLVREKLETPLKTT
jgi:glutamate formiminotransferase/formiminotetrahydrofolate cyclodeaminase